MKRLMSLIFAVVLALNAYASSIEYIDVKDGYYRIYVDGRETKMISCNYGTLLGYSDKLFVLLKDGYFNIYGLEGNLAGYISCSRGGEFVRVTGDKVFTRKDGYLISWNRRGQRLNECSLKN